MAEVKRHMDVPKERVSKDLSVLCDTEEVYARRVT